MGYGDTLRARAVRGFIRICARACEVGPRLFQLLVLACLLGSSAHVARAVTLSPGESSAISGTSSLNGTLEAQSIQQFSAFVGAPTLTTSVIKDNSTGTLDFVYSLTQQPPSVEFGTIIQTELYGFTGNGIDADFGSTADLIQHPNEVSLSADGDAVTFSNWLTSGIDVRVAPLVIRTGATTYVQTAEFELMTVGEGPPTGGGGTGGPHTEALQVFGPQNGVPEPSSAVLLSMGICLGLCRFRYGGQNRGKVL